MKKTFLILDANSILYRSYFALPQLTSKDGELINALYGFLLLLFKIIKELKPDFLAVCFDYPGKTFRHEEFLEYKAKRPKAPDELIGQIKKTKEALKAFSICFFEKEGFEADDLIASILKKIQGQKDIEKIIVSGDSDLFQLVKNNTKIYYLRAKSKKVEILDEKKLKERLGFSPQKLILYKIFKGDVSDNVPGIEGIGEKMAQEILKKIEDFQDLFSEKSNWKLNPKEREIIIKQKEQIMRNFKLLKLKENVEINFDLENCAMALYNKEEGKKFLEKLGFKSLVERLNGK